MFGSFLSRGLTLIFGYAYPAYQCFKTVEKNRPDIEDLLFWCKYWILVAVLTLFERVGDTFISWVPMYSEAKVAFFIYLWFPKTKGTTYVYDSFFRPILSQHETEIDRNLLELRSWAGDYAVSYWQSAARYGQTRVFDVLQYISSQSTRNSRPAPTQETVQGDHPAPATSSLRPTAKPQPKQKQDDPPPLPVKPSSSHSQEEEEDDDSDDEDWVPLPSPSATAPVVSNSNAQKKIVAKPAVGTSKPNTKTDESKEISTEHGSTSANGKSIDNNSSSLSTVQEIDMQDTTTIRVTRARLRKTGGPGSSG